MWFDEAIVYQIYPLGMCGAMEGEGARCLRVLDWIPHIKALGCDTVLFNPVFESDWHGYDTRDYFKIDRRLGSEEDFRRVCDALHENGVRVMLDAVLNHVGRGFWAFQDLRERRWDSPYKDWFQVSFDGNTSYNDGFWYKGWEGHQELPELNLWNNDVVEHQFAAIRSWVERFGIDGLRLDVAYCLPQEYLKRLRQFANGLKPDFVLMGETLHGDYNRWMGEELCHSVTNYECYKGLWSSLNDMNLFEIGHSLARQFGPEPWTLYKGRHMLSFLDNHDVERIATKLRDKKQLPAAWGLLFGMPGVPSVYYGSEWGIEGRKSDGDGALRPDIAAPEDNELTAFIASLAAARKGSPALMYGTYRNLQIQNKYLVFERACDSERVIVAVNASPETQWAHFDAQAGRGVDLITGETHDFGGGSELAPYSVHFWRAQ